MRIYLYYSYQIYYKIRAHPSFQLLVSTFQTNFGLLLENRIMVTKAVTGASLIEVFMMVDSKRAITGNYF